MSTGKKVKNTAKEISWLSFNERVLQEAEDKSVPLIERFKFLGIFSNNLDEFFRVRVATLKRTEEFRKTARQSIGENPTTLLRKIHLIVLHQQKRFETVFEQLKLELAANKIYLLNENQINATQGEFVKKYFREKVLPTLAPMMIETAPKFPYLKDKSIYFAVKLFKNGKTTKKLKYALLQIPTDVLSRFLILPKIKEETAIMLLDDVIRYCLPEAFSIFDINKAKAYTIKLTRDAELDIDNNLSTSLSEKISKSLKQRKKGKPVRLVYDSTIPDDMLHFITGKIKMNRAINLIPGGKYHNFKDFIDFPNVGPRSLSYEKQKPLQHPALSHTKSVFTVLRKKDILLSYPYQTYNHMIDVLREASIDPNVVSIKISLYRVANDSNVVYALANAIKNGKAVTVVVELRARFDEEANIFWANQLQDEGATVIFGVPGLKVHSKLFLITRKENNKTVDYAHIGSGNFNESTATVYCDHSLLTADPRVTSEVGKVFTFYGNNFKTGHYKHLLVAPFFMRKRIMKLLQNEIDNAKNKKPAYINFKLNHLSDPQILKKLYQAADAGVKVKLILRTTSTVIPSMVKHRQNLEVISIIDKYLEHARFMIFCNNGDEQVFLTSADMMLRNLDQRSEVAVQILDKKIKQQLCDIFNIQFSDNVKARILDDSQHNLYRVLRSGEKRIRSQLALYNYFKNSKA